MELKTFSVDDIRKLGPCYDPVTGMDDDGSVIHPGGFVPENWTGTALDVLKIDACPADDRLWLVLRDEWIDDTTLRLFAVWCARQALRLIDNPDPRSVMACDVAERFALGAATSQELNAAWSAAEVVAMDAAEAAWDAVWAAAEAAAWAAAWAAWTTARDAARASAEAAARTARAAARAAAEAAAWDAVKAAWTAARSAAEQAVEAAARAVRVAAWNSTRPAPWTAGWTGARAARAAAREEQVRQLIKMLEAED